MEWLKDYGWVLVLLIVLGVFVNLYRAMKKINVKSFLANKPKLPPHRDNNAQWDQDDWPDKKN